MSEQESSSEPHDFILPSSTSTPLLSPKKASSASQNGTPIKSESNGTSSCAATPEKREKYHRESAEVAKKKIKLDINPLLDSPDKNANSEVENLCEQYECSNRNCCLQLNQSCATKIKPEGEAEYFHLTKCEHICMICCEDLKRVYVFEFFKFNVL
uniref:Uncharacterized protein n=1 Tax=Panagrolaimus superbus TaxID=310955 RepID=A0A914YXF5_9BILA